MHLKRTLTCSIFPEGKLDLPSKMNASQMHFCINCYMIRQRKISKVRKVRCQGAVMTVLGMESLGRASVRLLFAFLANKLISF